MPFIFVDVDADKPFMRLQEQSEGKWYNFDGVDTDPCKKIMNCPVKAGEKTPFELTIVAGDAIHNVSLDCEHFFSILAICPYIFTEMLKCEAHTWEKSGETFD